MVVEVVSDVSAMVTSITALVAAIGGITGVILTFLRTQKHSDKISNLIEKASTIDGQVMGINQQVEQNKEKIGTILDVSEKLVPTLAEKHQQNKQKIDELKAQIDAIKAQLDRINALSGESNSIPVSNG